MRVVHWARGFLGVALAAALGLSLSSAGASQAAQAATVDAQPGNQPPAQQITQVPVSALQRGGYVIVFRHGSTDRGAQEPSPLDLSNCAVQNRLSEEGRREARSIGAAFQALKIPVGQVQSSGYCRTLETARLAFGRAEPLDVLLHPNYAPIPGAPVPPAYPQRIEALKRLLATAPAAGTNTVLVTHRENVLQATGTEGTFAEAWVYGPDGRGGSTLVARALPDGWLAAAGLPRTGDDLSAIWLALVAGGALIAAGWLLRRKMAPAR